MKIYLPSQMLAIGLELIGYDSKRQASVQDKTNLQRFGDSFGASPTVYAVLWEDLQSTTVAQARIDDNASVKHSLHFKCLIWIRFDSTSTKR